jgi:uncharacterized protein (TIGR02285 family)
MKSACRLLLLCLFGIGLSGGVAAQSRVTWLSLDAGPVVASAAGVAAAAPSGPGEQARLWLVERLPGFVHERDSASIARIERLIEQGRETYCYANALRTPTRETYAVFSDPVLRRLPTRVIVRADRLALLERHLDAQGRVQLAPLVNDPRLRGAVTGRRQYGPLIDPVLATSSAPQRVSDSNTPSRMLMARRIDWLVSEPAELATYVRNEPSTVTMPTRSFEIAGPAAPVLTYVMCSHTATGSRLVGALNQLMAEHDDRPWEQAYIELLDLHERADLMRLIRQSPQR